MRPLAIGLGIVFVPLVAFSIIMLFSVETGCGHPSNEALARRFYAHEAEFEALVEMARQDQGMIRIAPGFTVPRDAQAFSEQRWDDYRSRFERLGIQDGITVSDGSVRFFASDIGAFLRGTSKGYIYSQQPLEPCVPDLDKYRPQDRHHHWTVFRRLKPNWYLYFEA